MQGRIFVIMSLYARQMVPSIALSTFRHWAFALVMPWNDSWQATQILTARENEHARIR
jgi:hypothetical protein